MKTGGVIRVSRRWGQQVLNTGHPDAGWIFAICGIPVTERARWFQLLQRLWWM